MQKVFVVSDGNNSAWCDTIQQVMSLLECNSAIDEFEKLQLSDSDKETEEVIFTISTKVVSDEEYNEVMAIEFDGF